MGFGFVDVSYSIDTAHGVIHISGEIDPHKLLTDIKKVGKHAELIHADCGGGGQYSHPNYSHPGYEYDGRYTHNHTNYPYYESKPVHGYNNQSQYDPLQYHQYSNGLLPTAPEQRHAPPVAYYDQYDPNSPSYNCNIMWPNWSSYLVF